MIFLWKLLFLANRIVLIQQLYRYHAICTPVWSAGTVYMPWGFSCITWDYVVVCTTIVQQCTIRQKWPKQDKHDRNKATKTHNIQQDKKYKKSHKNTRQ